MEKENSRVKKATPGGRNPESYHDHLNVHWLYSNKRGVASEIVHTSLHIPLPYQISSLVPHCLSEGPIGSKSKPDPNWECFVNVFIHLSSTAFSSPLPKDPLFLFRHGYVMLTASLESPLSSVLIQPLTTVTLDTLLTVFKHQTAPL